MGVGWPLALKKWALFEASEVEYRLLSCSRSSSTLLHMTPSTPVFRRRTSDIITKSSYGAFFRCSSKFSLQEFFDCSTYPTLRRMFSRAPPIPGGSPLFISDVIFSLDFSIFSPFGSSVVPSMYRVHSLSKIRPSCCKLIHSKLLPVFYNAIVRQ